MTISPPRNEAESEDIRARLDALTSASDTSQIQNIKDYQAKHERFVRTTYGRFVDHFEMFFCEMTSYSHNINYLDKKNWPANRGLQSIIATHSLKQFYSAYTLLLSGSYEDSLALLRSVYESYLRIIFISCHPSHAGNVYYSPGQVGPRFNATNLITIDLGLKWNTYSITSAFAHSNMYNVMGDAIQIGIEKKPKLVSLTYVRDNDMVQLIMNHIDFLVAVYLGMYDQLFTVDISKHKDASSLQPHIDKLHEYALICHEILKSHNSNEYWRQAASDVEDIFKLITTMDANPALNFTDVWKTLRAE